jgi:putative ABC transport system permease protein
MHDLRFALRTFLKTPGPILLAIIAIALGIGANTAIFSVVRAVLLKPPPYAAPHRLVALFEADTAAGTPRVDTSLANYEEWRDRTQSFENVAASAYWIPALSGESEAEQLLAGHVTANFFTTLGVHPAMGRDFTPADDYEGRNTVVILSHAFWTSRLGRDPNVLGRKLLLDKAPYTIIGVMAPEFEHPTSISGGSESSCGVRWGSTAGKRAAPVICASSPG